jgi:RNA:NAD 2'-phosphotransferase (TPT1/KptA family)
MFALAVVIVPVALLLFALAMERVESRLQHDVVAEEEVEQFLEQAEPSEVRALYGHGIGRALEMFRLRRLTGRAARSGPRRARSGPSRGERADPARRE